MGLLLSLAALVPGLVLQDQLFTRDVPWLGVTYSDASPTTFGFSVYAFHAAGLLLLLVRYLVKRVRGERDVTAQCVALAAVILAVVHDSLESAGLIGGPYVLDCALLVMVLAVGGALTSSFVANARASRCPRATWRSHRRRS